MVRTTIRIELFINHQHNQKTKNFGLTLRVLDDN